jgi:hypothetical protein
MQYIKYFVHNYYLFIAYTQLKVNDFCSEQSLKDDEIQENSVNLDESVFH